MIGCSLKHIQYNEGNKIDSLTISTQGVGEFPNKWDANRSLRVKNGKILTWRQDKTNGEIISRECILLRIYIDSTHKTIYNIRKMYTNEKPFDNWNVSSIHWGPGYGGLPIGTSELFCTEFSSKPSEKEISSLLEEWGFFYIPQDEINITIEYGVDRRLWYKTFGFNPSDKHSQTIRI